jgi:hypothetical protein
VAILCGIGTILGYLYSRAHQVEPSADPPEAIAPARG